MSARRLNGRDTPARELLVDVHMKAMAKIGVAKLRIGIDTNAAITSPAMKM